MVNLRGALIVFEGLDRCGKSTQCKLLTEALREHGQKAKLLSFPDRTTPIGALLAKYLRKEMEMHDKSVHLLFSANRWELEPHIRECLASGTTIVLDRYSYSGVAYTSAKDGMPLSFCADPEDGLPRPDIVYFIDVNAEELKNRGLFGTERYESTEFQKKVAERFEKYKNLSNWKVIDGNKTVDDVHQEILIDAQELCKNVATKPVQAIEKEELCL